MRRLLTALCLCLALTPAYGDGGYIAADLSNLGEFGTWSSTDVTAGWEFSVDAPIEVTHLGMLAMFVRNEGQTVKIWDQVTKTLLTSADVPVVPPEGDWAWTELKSYTVLQPGTYVISAYYGQSLDSIMFLADPVNFGPGVSYHSSRYDWGDVFPNGYGEYDDYANFGPNFRYREPDVVPEPALLQLPVLLGLSGLALRLRRRS